MVAPAMPIYEYICSACGHEFEAIVFASTEVECSACASRELTKKLSVFSVGTKSSSTACDAPPEACGGCSGAGQLGGCGAR